MSIGIVSIGILVAAAMMPLALHQTEQGTRQDRAASAGRRAFREFHLRGMDDPTTWVVFDADNPAPGFGRLIENPPSMWPRAWMKLPNGASFQRRPV